MLHLVSTPRSMLFSCSVVIFKSRCFQGIVSLKKKSSSLPWLRYEVRRMTTHFYRTVTRKNNLKLYPLSTRMATRTDRLIPGCQHALIASYPLESAHRNEMKNAKRGKKHFRLLVVTCGKKKKKKNRSLIF